MQVTRIEPKSNTLEDLQDYLAKCASVVRDKDPKSAEKLWNRLITESVGGKASRVFEYIPCCVGFIKHERRSNPKQLFGFFYDNTDYSKYNTNARELLNWDWEMEDILEVVDFKHYRVFQCETPYFIYGQISTHNQLTTVSHSQRYADCDRGYWKPDEVTIPQDLWNMTVKSSSPTLLKNTMKDYGVVRKEVFDRGADMLQNRVFTIGGYTNNPNGWEHFVKQRLDKHTQLETREFTKMLNLDLKIDN